jgi:hypothetical protein
MITVCDRAAESCPVLPGDPERIHWSFEDPAAVTGTDADRQRAFDNTATQLLSSIGYGCPSLRFAVASNTWRAHPGGRG